MTSTRWVVDSFSAAFPPLKAVLLMNSTDQIVKIYGGSDEAGERQNAFGAEFCLTDMTASWRDKVLYQMVFGFTC